MGKVRGISDQCRRRHADVSSTFRFIKYCVTNHCCKGIDFKDAAGEDDIMFALTNLKICSDAESQCSYDRSFESVQKVSARVQINCVPLFAGPGENDEDPEWRNEH